MVVLKCPYAYYTASSTKKLLHTYKILILYSSSLALKKKQENAVAGVEIVLCFCFRRKRYYSNSELEHIKAKC